MFLYRKKRKTKYTFLSLSLLSTMLTETVLTASNGGLQLWDPRTGTVFSSYKLTGGDCRPHALAIGNTSVRGGDSKAGAIYVAQADKAMMHVYQFEKVAY